MSTRKNDILNNFCVLYLKGGYLENYVVQSECLSICNQLTDMENWLYEDGMECDRATYVSKLRDLKSLTNPIKARYEDYEQCPAGFKELKQAILHGRNAVNDFKHGLPKYEHLTDVEFLNITENCDRAQQWYDTNFAKFSESSQTTDSPVKVHEIYKEIQTLTNTVNKVINRPNPKPAAKATGNKDVNAMGDDQHQNGMNSDVKTEVSSSQGDDANIDMETE